MNTDLPASAHYPPIVTIYKKTFLHPLPKYLELEFELEDKNIRALVDKAIRAAYDQGWEDGYDHSFGEDLEYNQ